MQGGFEAAGDLATGGVFARTVEPHAGEATSGAHGHGRCLNCQATLVGQFCHVCGQAAHVHRTLFSIFHDVLHGVYHFEGKIWRTLPLLFWKPGSLTRRYIAGERVNFVSPLALFLFSVFLMVATFETIGGPIGSTRDENSVVHIDTKSLPLEIKRNRETIARLKDERTRLKATRDAAQGPAREPIDARVEALDKQIDKLDDETDQIEAAYQLATGPKGLSEALSSNNVKVNTGSPELDARIKKALKSPELMLYKLQSNAYKFSWTLVPISLPFIWILFLWRRDVGPYDHAIFAIYSLSAMTIGVVGLSVLRAIGVPQGLIGTLLFFGPPLHMYKQLRGAYRIGRFSAAWRTVALLLSAGLAAILFFVLLISLLG